MTVTLNITSLNEAIGFTNQILAALQSTLSGQSGSDGATANFLCGQLITNGSEELDEGGYQFWIDFANCFEAVQNAGATFDGMTTVLNLANSFAPVSQAAIAVKNFSIRMTLMEQARILAAMTFTSRQQLDDFFTQIDASFQAAELTAADNLDNVAYTLLLNVHASVSNDLSTREFTLPQMVTYSFGRAMPALWLAQRIYQDGSRAQEIISENLPVNPLFMPASGICLAE
jgi:prophage DNA circulation protein